MKFATPPLISVVIPTYNRAHTIGRALQSVLEQTFINWEAIVIDNHSQDDTDQVVSAFADQRITILKISNNGVIGASRNMGIRAAKGDWIAFLDSDDWWMPNKLQVCYERINNLVDLIYHDLELVTDHHATLRKKTTSWQVKKPVLIDLLVNGNAIANSSVVVRKQLLIQMGGIDVNSEMNASVDYNTWLRVAKITDGFLYIPRVLGSYLIHNGAVTQRDMSFSHQCAVTDFLELLSDGQKIAISGASAYMSGRYQYINGEYNKAVPKLKYSLKHGKINIRLRSLFTLILIAFKRAIRSAS